MWAQLGGSTHLMSTLLLGFCVVQLGGCLSCCSRMRPNCGYFGSGGHVGPDDYEMVALNVCDLDRRGTFRPSWLPLLCEYM